jgi:hypothetical protein
MFEGRDSHYVPWLAVATADSGTRAGVEGVAEEELRNQRCTKRVERPLFSAAQECLQVRSHFRD